MSIDEMVAQLDAQHPGWDMWRCADKGWCVKVGSMSRDSFHLPTLSEAMANAIAHKRLPQVPRRPQIYSRDLFTFRKVGNRYWVYYDGQEMSWGFTRKSEAESAASKIVERAAADREAWDAQYSRYLHQTEGVDFVWA